MNFVCFKCYQFGHFEFDCPQNEYRPSLSHSDTRHKDDILVQGQNNIHIQRQNDIRPRYRPKCLKCNQIGHFTHECEQIICYRCKEYGHTYKDCGNTPDEEWKAWQSELEYGSCYACNEAGHISRDCPNEKVCYICGLLDHTSKDCPGSGRYASEDDTICSGLSTLKLNNVTSEKLPIGDLSFESFISKHVTWKIPNALFLPNLVGYYIHSPQFSFASATWELRMFPYGHKKTSRGFVELAIVRLNSQIPSHDLFCKFHIITRSGKKIKSHSANRCFTSEVDMSITRRYCSNAKLQEMSSIYVPDGILTIICVVQTKKIAGDDKSFQTDSTPSSSSSECILQPPVALPDNKTLQELKELFFKQEQCDVVLKVKGQEFQAHKAILIAHSPVFASTFQNDMKEKSSGVVDIEDCDPTSFSDFLCYLYGGSLNNLSMENVFSLFAAADKYDIRDLRLECLEFLKKNLSVHNFCDIIILALRYSEKDLTKFTTEFFSKHYQEIIVTVKWQSFIVENPIEGNEIMIKALVPKNE